MFLYVGSYLLIYEFENWITGVFSPYSVSVCDFAYSCNAPCPLVGCACLPSV